MNIFVTDPDPVISAQTLCDKHVVKMVLESAQMLSTAWREPNDLRSSEFSSKYADEHELYKTAHPNHPCSIWVRQARENYKWLYRHFVALCDEYTHRYGKSHASARLKGPLMWRPFRSSALLDAIEEPYGFVLAMPDEYKSDDVFDSYRNYLMNEKQHFAKWEKDPSRKPTWWRT
tara:strand:+ start:6343 stop:6867 length:525 start_codon:yes stop_codon:yes gene_type:complete